MKRFFKSAMRLFTSVVLGLTVLSQPALAQITAGGVTGTGSSPAISFGDTQVNTTKVISITLSGDATVTFDTQAVKTDTLSNTPFSLVEGDDGCAGKGGTGVAFTCTIAVRYTPTAETSSASYIRVATTAPAGYPGVFINLSGTGITGGASTSGTLSITPSSPFTISASLSDIPTQILTLKATGGNVSIDETRIAVPDEWVIRNLCGDSVRPGYDCIIMLYPAVPGKAGTYPYKVVIQASDKAHILDVTLSVSESSSGTQGTLSVSPNSLNFGNLRPGESLDKTVTITAGVANVAFTGLDVPTGFSAVHSCGTLIPAGSSCTAAITFQPTKEVSYAGSAVINSSGQGAPHFVTLSGAGNASAGQQSALTVSPATLDFGTLSPGASLTKSFLITASGTNVTLAGITAPTGFTVLHSCGTVIPAGSTCSASVTFTPTELVPYKGSIIIEMPDTVQFVTLSGSGSASASQQSALTVAPATLDFGTLRPGTKQTKSVTITASGTNVTLDEITAPTGFTVVHSCGTLIPAGTSCSASVTFAPTAKIPYNGSLIIEMTSGSVQFVTLNGSGDTSGSTGGGTSGGVPMLVLDDALLDFGSVATGKTKEKILTLANRGGAELTVLPSLVGSGFSLGNSGCISSNNLGIVLAAGGSCTLTVKFSPTSIGAKTGNIEFVGAGATDIEISLKGSGLGAGSTSVSTGLRAASTNLAFGAVAVGGSAVKTLTLSTANGSRPSITSVVVPSGYVASHDCATASTATCTLTLALTPDAEIAYQGLVVVSATDGSAVFITVSGQGSAAAQMMAQTRGSNQAIDMTGVFRFSAEQTSSAGNLYVAVLYNDALFFLSGGQWTAHVNGVEPPAYMRAASLANELTILINQDVSMLSGAVVFLAYGRSFDEVVTKKQYTPVYVVE